MGKIADSIADRVAKLEDVTEMYLRQVESAFAIMNSFASGEHMKQWSRVDTSCVLAEVYGRLACGFKEFKEAVRNGKP